MKGKKTIDDECDCGSGKAYPDCCGRFHRGDEYAPTAEALMRSRYSAYVRCEEDYLRKTWAEETCPSSLAQDDDVKWLGLKVKAAIGGGEEDDTGEVEFVARYKLAGKGHRMHERSRFERRNGQWLYIDGIDLS